MKRVISLFSGCGGLDLGVKGGFLVHKNSINAKTKENWVRLPKNDFEIIFANDIMPQAKAVWEANFNGDYHLESIVSLLEKETALPDADVVIGGFPCQDFSVAGKRLGFDSERGVLYKSMVEVVRRAKPKVFIAENVYGLLSIKGAKETIIKDFENIGYTVFCFPLSAENFGVPQTRKRVFFVGFLKSALKKPPLLEQVQPKPTHKNPVILSHIFEDLQEPHETTDEEQKHYSKAKYYGKGRQGNIEVNLYKPGPTIRAEHHGNIEFRRLSKKHGGIIQEELTAGMIERRLTIRECARIQTFPDDFHIMKKKTGEKIVSSSHAYRVIGNAVPPLLAYHVAKNISDLWDDIL